MFESSNKCGIKSCVIKLLPLSDEDKLFISKLDREKLSGNQEFYNLVQKIDEFRRHYVATPLLYRTSIKDSFRNELQECCDNMKNSLNKKEVNKGEEITK